MNPYESDPALIPSEDAYADVPSYGRYLPKASDFRIDHRYIDSDSAAAQEYWRSVIKLCDESDRIYPSGGRGRDVFALGSVIVKSSHLHPATPGGPVPVDYTFADANEVQATTTCRGALKRVRLPGFYFVGKIDGRQTLIQERLPGVCLNVAEPYLTATQKESLKKEARNLLRQTLAIKPMDAHQKRGYAVRDPNILTNGRLNPLESQILFSDDETNSDMSLMHNDLNPSNIIVDDDRITGLIDWEMAGYIGLETAAEIHRKIRTPQRQHFVKANLSEERLQGIMWWNDLYDDL